MLACFDDDEAQTENFVVQCERCGTPVPDETLERLWTEERVDYVCRKCGHHNELALDKFDAHADSLVWTIPELRAQH